MEEFSGVRAKGLDLLVGQLECLMAPVGQEPFGRVLGDPAKAA
jgi:hypothetical protein